MWSQNLVACFFHLTLYHQHFPSSHTRGAHTRGWEIPSFPGKCGHPPPSNHSHTPKTKDTFKLGVKNQQGSYILILLKLLPETQGLSVNCSLEVKG